MKERPPKWVSSKRSSNSRGLRVYLVNCAWTKECEILVEFSKTASSLSFAQQFEGKNAKKNATHMRAMGRKSASVICEATTRK